MANQMFDDDKRGLCSLIHIQILHMAPQTGRGGQDGRLCKDQFTPNVYRTGLLGSLDNCQCMDVS